MPTASLLIEVTVTSAPQPSQSTLAVFVAAYTWPQSPQGLAHLVVVLAQVVVARTANVSNGVALGAQAVRVVVRSSAVGTGDSQIARQEGVGAVSMAQLLQSIKEVDVAPAIGGQQAMPVGNMVVV